MMSTRWQCWAKRSTSATTQAAPGNVLPHLLEGEVGRRRLMMLSAERVSQGK